MDTRLRKTECAANVTTLDNISGKVQVTIEYQVASLEKLLSTDDPLARLKDRTGEWIQNFVSRKDYFSIKETGIKDNLQVSELREESGISVKSFFNLKITWPDSITQRFQQSVLDVLDHQTQQNLNELKMQKLKDFGIIDPVLIASVLSKKDSDFNVIMDHVRSVSQVYKDQMDRDLSLLNWLKERDLLTRADVQDVIGSLTDRINNQSSLSSPILQGILSTTHQNNQQLGDGKSVDDEQEKGVGQEGPKVTGKRKINLSDKSKEQ